MAFQARVVKVLIASPGDTGEERDAVERGLHSWNASRSEREGVVLLPQRWETHAVPQLGGSAQRVINSQLVDRADILIALFDSRIGQATDDAVSGTAEEIQRAHQASKPVHVYFSAEPLPRDVSLEQLSALRDFENYLRPKGLLGSYDSPLDLAGKIRMAIEQDLLLLDADPSPSHHLGRRGAIVRARYRYDQGVQSDRTGRHYPPVRQRIEVTNTGDVTAERVRLELEPIAGGPPPILIDDSMQPDILAESHFDFPIIVWSGTTLAFRVAITWFEGGLERTTNQTLSA